jgi:hypothetical protein
LEQLSGREGLDTVDEIADGARTLPAIAASSSR